ncbi:Zinc finger ZZ-type and EF-hand domain containing protein 1, partial [Dissostichus eleginoides]
SSPHLLSTHNSNEKTWPWSRQCKSNRLEIDGSNDSGLDGIKAEHRLQVLVSLSPVGIEVRSRAGAKQTGTAAIKTLHGLMTSTQTARHNDGRSPPLMSPKGASQAPTHFGSFPSLNSPCPEGPLTRAVCAGGGDVLQGAHS